MRSPIDLDLMTSARISYLVSRIEMWYAASSLSTNRLGWNPCPSVHLSIFPPSACDRGPQKLDSAPSLLARHAQRELVPLFPPSLAVRPALTGHSRPVPFPSTNIDDVILPPNDPVAMHVEDAFSTRTPSSSSDWLNHSNVRPHSGPLII